MEKYVIEAENVSIRFNMANEKVDNLKEYFIKLIKHELFSRSFGLCETFPFK